MPGNLRTQVSVCAHDGCVCMCVMTVRITSVCVRHESVRTLVSVWERAAACLDLKIGI